LRLSLFLLCLPLALSACAKDPFVVERSPCPAVAVPQFAGDITRFTRAGSHDESALDFVATITRVRAACSEGQTAIATVASYDVVAIRRAPGPARTERLQVFTAVVRAGETLVNKEVADVEVRFQEGSARGLGVGKVRTLISASEVALSSEVNKAITRERKAGEIDAALDPLSEPAVRDAVRRATFEVLIGFQLSSAELAYNARK